MKSNQSMPYLPSTIIEKKLKKMGYSLTKFSLDIDLIEFEVTRSGEVESIYVSVGDGSIEVVINDDDDKSPARSFSLADPNALTKLNCCVTELLPHNLGVVTPR